MSVVTCDTMFDGFFSKQNNPATNKCQGSDTVVASVESETVRGGDKNMYLAFAQECRRTDPEGRPGGKRARRAQGGRSPALVGQPGIEVAECGAFARWD